jgi:hypothetical protein
MDAGVDYNIGRRAGVLSSVMIQIMHINDRVMRAR